MDINDSSWYDFIHQYPYANIFHTPQWASVLLRCYNIQSYLMALIENDQLIAGVPFSLVVNPINKKIVSLPFSDYCNPIGTNKELINQVVNGVVEYGHRNNIRKIELRWDYSEHPLFQFESSFVYHFIRLDSDLENVYKNISRTQKQNIHIAEKNNIELRWGQDMSLMENFYQLQCLTRRRQGLPVQPWKFFKSIVKELFSQNLGFVVLAYKDRNCIAGGVFLRWNKSLMYKYAASSQIDQNLRPNHLIIWKVLEWASANNIQIFDFGRCDNQNTGLRTFKQRWGAIENPLVYSYMGRKSQGSKSMNVHRFMNSIIHNTPVFVTRILGELFYKYTA